MEKLRIAVPAMYGDHHVVEVRRMLMELPGVEGVYASSAFQVVHVTYDPAKISPEQIESRLGENGYLNSLPVDMESGSPAVKNSGEAFFRHTAAYEQTRQVIGFTQTVSWAGRPLWYCPGIGVVNAEKMDEE